MFLFLSLIRVLPTLTTFAVLITAQDAKTLVFPSSGNDTASELRNQIESTVRPDITRPSDPFVQPPTISANHFFSAPQRTFLHHRSESVPYVYDHPSFVYPLAHSMDHSIGPPSKHLVIVSFIGLLLLFAIIQNTITAVKRREALIEVLSSRQKRDLHATYDFKSITPEQEDLINDDARVRCIQRTICLENQKLFKDMGVAGKILAKYLTRGVEKSLKSSPGWDRLVEDAGRAGIQGEDCNVLYRDCNEFVFSKTHRSSYNSNDTHQT